MSTPAQIEANQAQHSTGPRTPEGKAHSSANSMKLGLYAKQAFCSPTKITRNSTPSPQPINTNSAPTPPSSSPFSPNSSLPPGTSNGPTAVKPNSPTPKASTRCFRKTKPSTASRARTQAERTFHKSLKELRATKAARPATKPLPQNKPNYLPTSKGPYVRPEPKIGRNEPCPCNSGRKYKHCCPRNEANTAGWTAPHMHNNHRHSVPVGLTLYAIVNRMYNDMLV